MPEPPARIRPFRPADTDACYEVCLRTADDGGDASSLHRDPRVVGELWVGPYLALHPELAVVVEDARGVGGYIVGAPDTRAFEEEIEASWFPPLRERYPKGCFPEGSRDAGVVALIHDPLRMSADVMQSHPAHLHIDLLPRFQGRGLGRRMVNELFLRLRTAGVPAIHLACSPTNRRAIAFYRRLGFEDLAAGFIWGRSTEPV